MNATWVNFFRVRKRTLDETVWLKFDFDGFVCVFKFSCRSCEILTHKTTRLYPVDWYAYLPSRCTAYMIRCWAISIKQTCRTQSIQIETSMATRYAMTFGRNVVCR